MNLKNFNVAYFFRWPSKLRISGVVLLLSLGSCSSPLYTPVKENIPASANIVDLKKGRELYINKCGSCHTLFLPAKYDRANWTGAVNNMQEKAQISDSEKNLIIDYLSMGNK